MATHYQWAQQRLNSEKAAEIAAIRVWYDEGAKVWRAGWRGVQTRKLDLGWTASVGAVMVAGELVQRVSDLEGWDKAYRRVDVDVLEVIALDDGSYVVLLAVYRRHRNGAHSELASATA